MWTEWDIRVGIGLISALAAAILVTLTQANDVSHWAEIIAYGVFTAIGLFGAAAITFRAAEKSVRATRDQIKTASIPETQRSILAIARIIDQLSVASYSLVNLQFESIYAGVLEISYLGTPSGESRFTTDVTLPRSLELYISRNKDMANAVGKYRTNLRQFESNILASKIREDSFDRFMDARLNMTKDIETIISHLQVRRRDLVFLLEDAERILHGEDHS
jgi:hypothetical protein